MDATNIAPSFDELRREIDDSNGRLWGEALEKSLRELIKSAKNFKEHIQAIEYCKSHSFLDGVAIMAFFEYCGRRKNEIESFEAMLGLYMALYEERRESYIIEALNTMAYDLLGLAKTFSEVDSVIRLNRGRASVDAKSVFIELIVVATRKAKSFREVINLLEELFCSYQSHTPAGDFRRLILKATPLADDRKEAEEVLFYAEKLHMEEATLKVVMKRLFRFCKRKDLRRLLNKEGINQVVERMIVEEYLALLKKLDNKAGA